MASDKKFTTFREMRMKRLGLPDAADPSEGPNRVCDLSTQFRMQYIERDERAKMAVRSRHIDIMWAAQQARTNTALERLGLSVKQSSFPAPLPSPAPRQYRESSTQTCWFWPPSVDEEESVSQRMLQTEDWNQKPASAMTAMNFASPASSLSSVDLHTPCELRMIPLVRTPTPPPARPTPPRQPVHKSSKIPVWAGQAGKVAVETKQIHLKETVEKLKQFQPDPFPSRQHPAPPQRPSVVPKPPQKPAPTNRRGPRYGTNLRPQEVKEDLPLLGKPMESLSLCFRQQGKVEDETNEIHQMETVGKLEKFQPDPLPRRQPPAPPQKSSVVPKPPQKPAPTNRRGPRRGANLRPQEVNEDLQPLGKPMESLSLCIRQLQSQNWEDKIAGLKSIRCLAKFHSDLLQTKLHEVCLVVTEEVKNLRSVVAIAAMNTLAVLHTHMGKSMDPEVDWTGRALLLKFTETTSPFVYQQANRALDALVEGCSPRRVMAVLLRTGLSHLCAAVRGSMAQHLHQLVRIMEEDNVMTADGKLTESIADAVSKMCIDAAAEVRQHGRQILQRLVHQREFMLIFNEMIPIKNRAELQKLVMKLKQQR